MDSIISVSTQLHRSGFNLEFETSSSQSDTRLLIYGREKAKLVVASKTAPLLSSSNVKLKLSFQRKRSSIVLKFPVNFLKGNKCFLMDRQLW